jgi:hypothetical protein
MRMTPEELKLMSDAELTALRDQVAEEQVSRTCQAYVSGLRKCDHPNVPHDMHGYTMWDAGNRQIRVTWTELNGDTA